MTMAPCRDEKIEFLLKFQPELGRDPLIEEISWTNLWVGHPSNATELPYEDKKSLHRSIKTVSTSNAMISFSILNTNKYYVTAPWSI